MADDLTDEQIKAFRLADNKVGEIATWDLSALVDELKDINFLDMEDFGFLNADDLRTDFFDEKKHSKTKTINQHKKIPEKSLRLYVMMKTINNLSII